MIKSVDSQIVLKALDVAREQFFESGVDILDKLSTYRSTGTISGYLGDKAFDYIDFSKVMNEGFNSVSLQLLFESFIYLHYFGKVSKLNININDFLFRRTFDSAAFDKKAEEYSKVLIAIDVLKTYVNSCMRQIGIKRPLCLEIINSTDSILEILKTFKDAVSISLHHYGNASFLASKIPISEEHPFDISHPVNPHVFYTNNPEQILTLAHKAVPGVYIIANVPYNNHADTAFYFLFRQKGYAYLVENSKHSYRDQIYRNKTNGTPGRDAWLDRRYDTCNFPVSLVLEFFEGTSKENAISITNGFDFRSLGKITDEDPTCLLYTYAFIDRCYTFLKNKEFTDKISNTSCADYISKLLSKSLETVPVLGRELLPSLKSLDTVWSSESVSVENVSIVLKNVEDELPVIKDINLSDLPQGCLTSVEHLKRAVVYRKRLQEAETLEKQWQEDFKANQETVYDSIKSFIVKKGTPFILSKGLKNLSYPMQVYREFGLGSIPEASKLINATILSRYDSKKDIEKENIHFISPTRIGSSNYTYGYERSFTISKRESSVNRNFLCCGCEKTLARYSYELRFLDWDVFQAFFEVTEEEMKEIPFQLKRYFNQSSTAYFGNRILNDLDPITLIHNPWFSDSLNTRSGKSEIIHSNNRPPAFFVHFHLCGHCRKKLTNAANYNKVT